MKAVLIVVGVLLALFVVLTIAGAVLPGGGAELSVGDIMVAPTYSGQLIDTQGAPFAHAKVYMLAAIGHPEKRNQDRESMPMQYTTTDTEGRFSFRDVARGTYSMQVYWDGDADKGHLYLDAQKCWLAVDPGGSAEVTVVARALSESSVGGTVRDAQGQPVAGASVKAMGYADYSRSEAKTDAEGRYLVRGIAGDAADTIWFDGPGKAERKNVAVGTKDADVTLR